MPSACGLAPDRRQHRHFGALPLAGARPKSSGRKAALLAPLFYYERCTSRVFALSHHPCSRDPPPAPHLISSCTNPINTPRRPPIYPPLPAPPLPPPSHFIHHPLFHPTPQPLPSQSHQPSSTPSSAMA